MNFITYINQLGSFKTALVNYDAVAETVVTQNAINEDYLVTSVFVNGVKRAVDIENAVQLAVINDTNFDGNLLDVNHYNVEGTYFSAKLLSLASAGVSDVGSVVSTELPLYKYPKPFYAPMLVGENNKTDDGIVYFDHTVWNDALYMQFVAHSYYDPVTKKSVPRYFSYNEAVSKTTAMYYAGISLIITPQSSFTPTIANTVTVRVYYNVLTNCFSLAVCAGNVFIAENSYSDFQFEHWSVGNNNVFLDYMNVNKFTYTVSF